MNPENSVKRNLQHFVLTRFNIASAGRESAIRNTPGWLERRFHLFETYCLSSMAAQDPGSFTWLIYFDEQTPEEFRARISAAQRIVPFEAIFVKMLHRDLIANHVLERLAPGSDRVITTRLDNDDAISRDYLAYVRQIAESVDNDTVINFRWGIALKDGRLYTARDDSNPFVSLVEASEAPKTIWTATHTQLPTLYKFKQVLTEPRWLQVVHGENVANRIKGKLLDSKTLNLVMARFALSDAITIRNTMGADLLLDRMLLFPARLAREGAFKVAKFLLRRH
jgi:hypothetical protein